jgi:hypothetical protein
MDWRTRIKIHFACPFERVKFYLLLELTIGLHGKRDPASDRCRHGDISLLVALHVTAVNHPAANRRCAHPITVLG